MFKPLSKTKMKSVGKKTIPLCIVHTGLNQTYYYIYLQLAVVQAGHRNLIHFHLPELEDEPTLLCSCCKAACIGQDGARPDKREDTYHNT